MMRLVLGLEPLLIGEWTHTHAYFWLAVLQTLQSSQIPHILSHPGR